jgi:hypothetical protein
MSEYKFTPGPWKITKGSFSGIRIYGADKLLVAEITDFVGQPADANAKLIKAAPELLDALKEILDFWESGKVPKRYEELRLIHGTSWVRQIIRNNAHELINKIIHGKE